MRVEGKVDIIFCYALLRIQHPIKVMYLKYYLKLKRIFTFADFCRLGWQSSTKVFFFILSWDTKYKIGVSIHKSETIANFALKHNFGGQNRLIKPMNWRCRTTCQYLWYLWFITLHPIPPRSPSVYRCKYFWKTCIYSGAGNIIPVSYSLNFHYDLANSPIKIPIC